VNAEGVRELEPGVVAQQERLGQQTKMNVNAEGVRQSRNPFRVQIDNPRTPGLSLRSNPGCN